MRFVCCALLVLAFTGCGQEQESAAERYERWLASGHREQVMAYEDHLRDRDVAGIVAMPQLLRSGRHWRRCHADEFALVRDLESNGILKQPQVASAWRNDAFNRCEGGSTKSRHLRNNALDFDIPADDRNVARLCDYWNRQGRGRHFGLGFYSTGRIHVDTSGFRTWGHDYGRKSSLCAKERVPGQTLAPSPETLMVRRQLQVP